jgi:hypothetical protein
MTESARNLFRQSVQTGVQDARNARGVFRPRAFRACTRAPPSLEQQPDATRVTLAFVQLLAGGPPLSLYRVRVSIVRRTRPETAPSLQHHKP